MFNMTFALAQSLPTSFKSILTNPAKSAPNYQQNLTS